MTEETEETFFTSEEILSKIQDNIEYYDGDCFDDLFNDLFNSSYYIIGTYAAAKALEQFTNDEDLDGFTTMLNGVFGAIDLVEQYEKFDFGEVTTDLSNPEQLANMVEYIRAEAVFSDVLDAAGLNIDDDINDSSIKAVKNAIEDIKQ